MPSSRRGIWVISTVAPLPHFAANSERQQVSPPPPRSLRPCTSTLSRASKVASMTCFLVNGSPICTAGLLSNSEVVVSSSEANVTPCIPSRPVLPPISTKTSPTFGAIPLTIESFRTIPAHKTFTSGFDLKLSSNSTSPPTVGIPTRFP